MEEPKTIIVMGVGRAVELHATILESLRMEHGADLIVLSESEAREQGVLKGTVPSVTQYKFTAPPIMKLPKVFYDEYNHKEECKKGWRK